jgi:uncharacterized protein (DUF1015 family)
VADLTPFRALGYDRAKIGDAAAVVAPPYDVIDDAYRTQLAERSPYNAVHLICSVASDPYGAAAASLAEWRRSGVLRLDPTPAFYLYAQRFPMPEGGARERVGIMGTLRLEPGDGSRVLGHENTKARAKDDRRRLLEACRTSLSPIFGLISSPGWSFRELMPPRAPDLAITDDARTEHRVWRLADPETIAQVEARIRGRHVFIADGHHRFETAREYAADTRAVRGPSGSGIPGYEYTLAYLDTLEDPGLVVLPTHRVLETLALTASDLRRAITPWFEIEEVPWDAPGAARARTWLAGSLPDDGAVRIVAALRGAGALWLLSAKAADLPFDARTRPELRTLDVSALHAIVLERALGIDDGARTGGIEYTQDAGYALARVAAGAAAAFLLPATDLTAIRDVSTAGLTMPAKSTFFHPKLLTGLVFYPHDGAGA